MEYDIVEFLINNKADINVYLDAELHPTYLASRIFDSAPDLQQEIIEEKRRSILIRYLLEQFPEMNYLNIVLTLPDNYVTILSS